MKENFGSPGIAASASSTPEATASGRARASNCTEGEKSDRIAASIPLRRIGRPEDIAYCALYLASDEASWVTGTNITVDGGTTAG